MLVTPLLGVVLACGDQPGAEEATATGHQALIPARSWCDLGDGRGCAYQMLPQMCSNAGGNACTPSNSGSPSDSGSCPGLPPAPTQQCSPGSTGNGGIMAQVDACLTSNTWEGYTVNGCPDAQAGFLSCPASGTTCPAVNNIEQDLASLGCLPGGTPPSSDGGAGTRWANYVQSPTGTFDYWLYALCLTTTNWQSVVTKYGSQECWPDQPTASPCSTGTYVVIYYDPSCGGHCNY